MDYEQIKCLVKNKFIESNALERFYHMEEVVKMALFLNKKFNFQVEEKKIKIAGIAHDYTKMLTMEKSRLILRKYVSADELEEIFKAPTIVHSLTAYYVVEEELGITDEDIKAAIKNHTTGRPGMSNLEKLIFVSDAVEWTRTYQGVDILRTAVLQDFNQGMLLMMETTLKHLQEKGYYINPLTQETYNYYRREYENN